MLRFYDFVCIKCGLIFEELLERTDLPLTVHCGIAAIAQPMAPAVHFKTRYSHVLGRNISTSREEDVHLAKSGQYIPTAFEAKQVKDMTEAGIDPVIVGPPPSNEKILRSVDKAMERAHADGVFSCPE